MKIAIIGPAHPLRGGIADFNEALAAALELANHQTAIFSFSLQYPNFLFPGKSQFTDAPPPTISIHTIINSINPFNWIKSANSIVAYKPDMVIIRFWLPFMAPCLGSIAHLIKRKLKIPVIAITDNVIPHEKRFGDRVFIKYFLSKCDAFMAMSNDVAMQIDQFIKAPLKAVSPHPIYNIFGSKIDREQAKEKLALDRSDKVILFFGFIRKYKGLELLLQALAMPQIKALNIKCIVAGEFYEDKASYIDFIETHSLQENVLLHDYFIPKESVNKYFSAADLVVQPYLSATQSGITQIAYHFDVPMLVTNVGGLAEIVNNQTNGYVVPTFAASIADAISDFYKGNKYETMSAAVQIHKEKFSWNYFVQNLIALYEKIH